MSKRGGNGWHLTSPPQDRGCVVCRRPIAYGDRCPDHQQQLRQRRRWKVKRR